MKRFNKGLLALCLLALTGLGLSAWTTFDQSQDLKANNETNSIEMDADEKTTAINWITLEEALKLNEKKRKKRKILIDFYTDWCGWCKRMDANTFENPEIAAFINDNFYAVKFDAEQKESVDYKGKTYVFKPGGRRGGTNEFALNIAAKNGRIGYPTLVWMDEDSEPIQVSPGYHDPKKMDQYMNYFAGDYHKDFDFQTFVTNVYESKF